MLLANNIFQQTVTVWNNVGKNGPVCIHNHNLQILPSEIYKIKNYLHPLVVTELLE